MSRLIDADDFIEKLAVAPMIQEAMRKALNHMPTIEVVRCKDCRWGREACGNIECSVDLNLPPEYHGYEWFCPNGERREDGKTD